MKTRGFTIIEMLIVLSIIGAVALITMPYVISAKFKGDLTACISNERNLAQSLEIRKNITGRYPEKISIVVEAGYMARMPDCPSNGKTYDSTYEVDEKGTEFTISCPGIHDRYLKYIKPTFPQYTNGNGLDIGEKK